MAWNINKRVKKAEGIKGAKGRGKYEKNSRE